MIFVQGEELKNYTIVKCLKVSSIDVIAKLLYNLKEKLHMLYKKFIMIHVMFYSDHDYLFK